MIAENYPYAYKEVIEVLKYTQKSDVDKIPNETILVMLHNMKKDYMFRININKPLKEQKLLPETRAILASLFKKYWATDEQKAKIEAAQKTIAEEIKKENEEKYNPDNLFKAKHKETISQEPEEIVTEETSLTVVKKETWISKIINKVKSFFKK